MLIVGLTGGTASGKTEVAKILQKKGAIIISGDEIGKEVVEKSRMVLRKLIHSFGTEILDGRGKLNRRRLGRLAFSNPGNQKRLNRIVHPFLLKELKLRIAKARKVNGNSKKRRSSDLHLCVVDAALITEWGLEKELDMTILVATPNSLRLKRLFKQGLTPKEAKDRIDRQLSDRDRRKTADYVIENDGSLSDLRKKARNLYHILMTLLILQEMEELVIGVDKLGSKSYFSRTMLKNSQGK